MIGYAWYGITSYLRFYWGAFHLHGVHSPFIFKFEKECLRDNSKYVEYEAFAKYRSALISKKNKIQVTDLGSGSRTLRKKSRLVSQIASNAGASKRRTQLLYRVARYFNVSTVLELGTSLGLGTFPLATAAQGKVTTLEGCPETAAVAKATLSAHGADNVDTVLGSFRESLKKIIPTGQQFDLIYLDGHHDYQATLDYFEMLLPTAHENSVWILDDIHWSRDMAAAWLKIKEHPQVTATVDCYWLGFIFFRKGQVKEDFRIRI